MIANLAIHMNREINNGYPYHVQTDLLPIIGSGDKDFSVPELIAKETGIPASDILSFDLCLYNRMDGTFWGADKEFISCSKLDDLQCAFASVKALSETCHPDILSAAVIFDSEEVGSQSLQGAGSTFLKDCLERINMTLGYTQEDYLALLPEAF